MRRISLTIALLGSVLMAACGGREEPLSLPGTEQEPPIGEDPAITAARLVQMTIVAPEAVAIGHAGPIALKFENTSGHPATLVASGAMSGNRPVPALRVKIRNEQGELIRVLPTDVPPPTGAIRVVLAPGEESIWEFVWDQMSAEGTPVAPGVYLLEGEILGRPALVAERVIRIESLEIYQPSARAMLLPFVPRSLDIWPPELFPPIWVPKSGLIALASDL